jgi:hypothetical protein
MILDPDFFLLLLCGIYHGPRCKWFVKHGIADFGDFIVILLIMAKVDAANGLGRFPEGSIRMIQTFLQIFPLLNERQRDILSKFISDDDVDGFFREHFGADYQKIVAKYEDTFRVILPTLFQNGLTISPNYRGRYACSTALWVVAKTIFSFMERYTRRPLDDPSATILSQNTVHSIAIMRRVLQTTALAIAIMRDLRHNPIWTLYIETMVHVELTNDPKCFEIAESHFRDILDKNQSHYEAWLEFIADFRRRTYIRIGESPNEWNSRFICWLMNSFQSYEILSEYMAKNPRKN